MVIYFKSIKIYKLSLKMWEYNLCVISLKNIFFSVELIFVSKIFNIAYVCISLLLTKRHL